jgi:ferredoxin
MVDVLKMKATMSVIVKIDRKNCIQSGRCYEENCPEVFKGGADGTSEIVELYRDGSLDRGKVPDEKLECAKRAVGGCPVAVITAEKE